MDSAQRTAIGEDILDHVAVSRIPFARADDKNRVRDPRSSVQCALQHRLLTKGEQRFVSAHA
jgi:hypothetical protein